LDIKIDFTRARRRFRVFEFFICFVFFCFLYPAARARPHQPSQMRVVSGLCVLAALALPAAMAVPHQRGDGGGENATLARKRQT
jgi:hypothetical protein